MLVFTLTTVEIGTLLRRARHSAEMTSRAAAQLAGISYPTINRIEMGHTDARFGTAVQIIAAYSSDLRLQAIPHGIPPTQRLDDLAEEWELVDGELKPTWVRWRAWLDAIALHPERTCDAIYPIPNPSGHRTIDALIAAIAEKLADDAGLSRPSWTAAIPPADPTFEPPSRRRGGYCEQFESRNLLISADSLFRPKENLGV